MLSGGNEVGKIERSNSVYLALCTSLSVEPVDPPNWMDIDVAIIFRRGKQLGLLNNLVTFTAIDPDKILSDIEKLYLARTSESYKLEIDPKLPESEAWTQIHLEYLSKRESLSGYEIVRENNRYQTARALQLNKYLATWEDIKEELKQLNLLNKFILF